MKKIKILDTNVFLHDPMAMFKFPKELIIVPISVIEELDKFKKNQDELGRNAREVLRKIDKLVEHNKGSISDSSKEHPGVELLNKARLLIELNHIDEIQNLDNQKTDNRILSVAMFYLKKFQDAEVKLLTKDAAVRIKGDALGIKSDNYEADVDSYKNEDSYKGYSVFKISEKEHDAFIQYKKYHPKGKKLNPNEYVLLINDEKSESGSFHHIGKYDATEDVVKPLSKKNNIWGVTPKNAEQVMALDLLLDPNIPLITLSGQAGTGKTLLAVAAAMEQTLDKNVYTRTLISRPVFPLGKDIGYLPGTMEEKLSPWMQPIFDNLEFLFNSGSGGSQKRMISSTKSYQQFIDQGIIQIEPLMYIRGRSIPNQIMIIDEAQNLSKHEVKTILSRAGEGTKIILTGDPDQIDNPYVDKTSNGLSQVIERFKNEPLAGHITLSKGERSPLAETVVKIFSK